MPAITYKSTTLTALDANASQSAPTYGSDLYGGRKLRYKKVEYTIPATGGAVPLTTDIIQLCKLPKGATLDPSLSTVYNELAHTACTLNIGCDGVTADVDRYAAAIDCKAANALVCFASNACAAQKTPYTTLAEVTVSAAFASTVTLNGTASKMIFTIAYWLNS